MWIEVEIVYESEGIEELEKLGITGSCEEIKLKTLINTDKIIAINETEKGYTLIRTVDEHYKTYAEYEELKNSFLA